MAAVPTPADPPPIPTRKPAPPAGWQAKPVQPIQAARAVVTPVVERAPLRAVSAVREAAPGAPHLASYRVRPGDTVFGVARRLGVPLRSVVAANGLRAPYKVHVGQVLRIPNPRRHVVEPGDTVYGVSRRYGVDLRAFVRLNRLQPPFVLTPGDDLILPVWTRKEIPVIQVAATRTAATPAARPAVATADKVQVEQAPPRRIRASKPAPPVRLAALPKPPPRAGSKFLWPAEGRLIASYGPKEGGLHNDGINIAAPHGAPIRAAENGVVIYRGNELRGFGNLILVRHAGGWVTAYAHTDEFLVRRGETSAM